jgi:ribosome maturation factor RimP
LYTYYVCALLVESYVTACKLKTGGKHKIRIVCREPAPALIGEGPAVDELPQSSRSLEGAIVTDEIEGVSVLTTSSPGRERV